ncbi:MAG TPA: xylose isomerase [Candidatus Peribacteraceae bacterium]|nr:xylose isomerase [Candidatus Peribacteraceae bacterium]
MAQVPRVLTFRDFGLKEDPFPFLKRQPITFQGIGCKEPFAFSCYNPGEKILGKPMYKHLPMAMAYWHTMRGLLADMFGPGTAVRPWEGPDTMENAENRLRVAFYFMWMQGIEFWCFHDTDIVPYGKDLKEFHANIDRIVPLILELQKLTGIRCGWVTQNLFSHPMYCKGAATGTHPIVWAHAFAQTRKMLEVGKKIGARNHVFWGGREGYNELLLLLLGLEQKNLARFLQMAVQYKKQIGATVQFLIEPKPKEPTVSQYDMCMMVVYGFLRRWGLASHFKGNIEVNHAQLVDLPMEHELTVAADLGMLGGIDGNQGTFGNGWDTDDFLADPMIALRIMIVVLKNGGLGRGVINWDAKPRRESFMPEDLFRTHTAGMDTLAYGLRAAALLQQEGKLEAAIAERYAPWLSNLGRGIAEGSMAPDAICEAAYAHEPKLGTDIPSSHIESHRYLLVSAMQRCCMGVKSTHIEPTWRLAN